uniref:Uncharacterized protein n=1 Tax=Acrobeloides nanus TaxID=290746 RepID=A0A914CHI2_9BILA
MQESEATIK